MKMISKSTVKFKIPVFANADILDALSDKNFSGIGIVHSATAGFENSVWVFPAIKSHSGIQIEYKPICRKLTHSNINKHIKTFTELAYFNYQNLKIVLQDQTMPFIHFIQGDLSFGSGRDYKTFFAFPSEESKALSFKNVRPLHYLTGMPYRLDQYSMTYLKSYETVCDESTAFHDLGAFTNTNDKKMKPGKETSYHISSNHLLARGDDS